MDRTNDQIIQFFSKIILNDYESRGFKVIKKMPENGGKTVDIHA